MQSTDEMFCTIWYYLYNFVNLKNTHERLLLLDAGWACNFTKNDTFP